MKGNKMRCNLHAIFNDIILFYTIIHVLNDSGTLPSFVSTLFEETSYCNILESFIWKCVAFGC